MNQDKYTLVSRTYILNYVDMDSEVEDVEYKISLITLNMGIYFLIPAIVE